MSSLTRDGLRKIEFTKRKYDLIFWLIIGEEFEESGLVEKIVNQDDEKIFYLAGGNMSAIKAVNYNTTVI